MSFSFNARNAVVALVLLGLALLPVYSGQNKHSEVDGMAAMETVSAAISKIIDGASTAPRKG